MTKEHIIIYEDPIIHKNFITSLECKDVSILSDKICKLFILRTCSRIQQTKAIAKNIAILELQNLQTIHELSEKHSLRLFQNLITDCINKKYF